MRYYCGFELTAVEGWQSFIGEVKAPSNYVDPVKKAAYVERRIAELEGTACSHPLAGTINRAVILKDGKVEFDEKGNFVGTKFLEFIFKDSGLEKEPASRKDNLLIVGCPNMHAAARLAAMDYILVNGSLPFALHWALDMDPDLRYNRVPGYMDPVSALVGSSSFSPEDVARKFGLPVDMADAESLAVLASQLAARLGL